MVADCTSLIPCYFISSLSLLPPKKYYANLLLYDTQSSFNDSATNSYTCNTLDRYDYKTITGFGSQNSYQNRPCTKHLTGVEKR